MSQVSAPAGRPVRRWQPFVLGIVAGIVVVGVLGLFVGAPLTIAHRNNLPLELWYGNFAVDAAARAGASSVPPEPASLLNDRRAIQAGMYAYTGSCAVCHNANGDGKGAFGQGTFPPATNLISHDAKEKSDAGLFWIIKNGLSFTGMPGFGKQYGDQDIWSLVAYIRTLQNGQSGTLAPVSLVVPAATADQVALADPTSGDPIHRGAAVYFAQGCASCHGASGNGPGEMALRGLQSREAAEAVRQGRAGMPHYDASQISDSQLSDLAAYIATFPSPQGRPGGPGGPGRPGGPGGVGGGEREGGRPGGPSGGGSAGAGGAAQ